MSTIEKSNVERHCEVSKVDAEHGIVFGYAIVCCEDGEPYFDLQGDHIPEEAMLKAVVAFMAKGAPAKVQHAGAKIGQVLLSFPVTQESAAALGWTVTKTGWVVGWKPDDKAVVKRFLPGPNGEPPELTGFSIGGRGRRVPVTP